jgi:AcrR family transcriptional regulator
MAAAPTTSPTHRPARERIFEAAKALFYSRGIRAVGVETVVAEANATKMSLYREYPSKDDLVVAYLKDREALYWSWWDATAAKFPDARRQIHEQFAAVARRIAKPGYRGCPFTNAAVEFPEPDHPARAVATANKRELRRRLKALASDVGARNPATLADGLFLLLEGAYASCQTGSASAPATSLVAAADALVAGAVD